MKYIVWVILFFTSCSQGNYVPASTPYFGEPLAFSNKSNMKAVPRPELRKKISVIVIDPGHGGEDFGTHSINPSTFHEKYLTLSTAMCLNNMLHQMGYQTAMTRNTDVFIPLKDRAKMANQKNTSLFVSIHYNSAPSRKAEGMEVFYYKGEEETPRSKESKKLAKAVLDQMLTATNAKSRGVKNGNFLVIRETTMPAILIEAGFLTNESEMDKIKNAAYIKKIAWGIAQGIKSYMDQQQK